MYIKNEKVYFEAQDFEKAVAEIVKIIESNGFGKHIVTPYRGGLPLGVRLSNQLNIPLSVLDYQRLDGEGDNLTTVSIMKNAGISSSDTIYLVDDIADEGITIKNSIEFLQKEFPNNKIVVYTIFGNNEKHNNEWLYTFKHTGDWIVFVPWEGYN